MYFALQGFWWLNDHHSNIFWVYSIHVNKISWLFCYMGSLDLSFLAFSAELSQDEKATFGKFCQVRHCQICFKVLLKVRVREPELRQICSTLMYVNNLIMKAMFENESDLGLSKKKHNNFLFSKNYFQFRL